MPLATMKLNSLVALTLRSLDAAPNMRNTEASRLPFSRHKHVVDDKPCCGQAEEEGAPSAETILSEAETRAHGDPLQGLRALMPSLLE